MSVYTNKKSPNERAATPQKTYTFNFVNQIIKEIPKARYYQVIKLITKFKTGNDKFVTIFTDENNKVLQYNITMEGVDKNGEKYYRCTDQAIKNLNYFKNLDDRDIIEKFINSSDDIEAQY